MAMSLSRRNFLVRTGVLGAMVATAQSGLRLPAFAQSADDLLGPVFSNLNPALQQLGIDAISGFSAFVVPGPDAYSEQQGLTEPRPGAVAALNPQFLIDVLDFDFVPLSDTGARAVTQALVTATTDIGIPQDLIDAIGLPALDGATTFDDLIIQLFENDQTIPTGLVIAMYLNLAASQVNPASMVPAPFTAPFANLSWADKGAAVQAIEEQHAGLAEMLDANLPEPVEVTVSGLIKFAIGALLEYAAFGTYTEYAMFDPDNPMTLKGRPVGWEISGFQPGQLTSGEGWDEFLG
ncbi:MAG TPA: twin-arginine translocation signal domain-containing protein, partial [Nitriliruptorales bacterium]